MAVAIHGDMSVNAWLPVLAVLSLHATARADAPGETPPLAQRASLMPDAALSWPEEIDADDGRSPPLGYTSVQRTRKGLVIGGAVTLGVGYMYSALIAAQGRDNTSPATNDTTLWIPIVGAFIELDKTDDSVGKAIMLGIGGAQVIGAFMLYYGITTTKRVFVRSDLVGNLTVAPMAGNGMQGLSLAGRF